MLLGVPVLGIVRGVYPLARAAEVYSAKAAGGIPGRIVLQP